MFFGELFGFIAGAFGVMQGLPQARRVKKLGHSVGVSLVTWVLIYSSNLGWFAYGVIIKSPSIIATNIFASLLSVYVILALRPHSKKVRAITIGAWFIAPTFAFFIPVATLKILLIPFAFSRAPQLLHSIKMARTPHHSAVSFGSLSISLTALVCWEIYSIFLGNFFVLMTTSIPLTFTLAIFAIELVSKRKKEAATL